MTPRRSFGRGAVAASVFVALAVAAFWARGALLSSVSELRFNPVAGQQLFYGFDYRSEGIDSPGMLFGARASARTASQQIDVEITGTLVQTTIAGDRSGSTLVWNVIRPAVHYASDLPLDGVFADRLRADLAGPFVTRLDRDGRMLRFAAPSQTSRLASAVARGLLAQMQVVAIDAVSKANDRSYATEEPDTDGQRTSRYTVELWVRDPVGVPKIAFTRTSVLSQSPETETGPIRRPVVAARGDDRGLWRRDGTLDSIEASSLRDVYVGGDRVAQSHAMLRVLQGDQTTLDAPRLTATLAFANHLLRSNAASGLHAEPSPMDVKAGAFRAALGSDDAQTLATRLALASEHRDTASFPSLAQRFAALFYLQPERIAGYAPTLASVPPQALTFSVLVAALQQTGTPAAQHALTVAVLARSRDRLAAIRILTSFALMEEPSAMVDDALLTLAVTSADSGVRAASEFAIGSVAYHLRNRDERRRARLLGHLRAVVREARTEAHLRVALLALGNAGDSAALTIVASSLRDARTVVRAAAVTALRFVTDAASRQSVTEALADPNATVRLAGVSALGDGELNEPAFAALCIATRYDRDRAVRALAIDTIWKSRERFPAAYALVRDLAEHDRDATIRAEARRILASDPNATPVWGLAGLGLSAP